MKKLLLMMTCLMLFFTNSTCVQAAATNPFPYNTKEEILAEMYKTYEPIFDTLAEDSSVHKDGQKYLADESFRKEFLEICYNYDERPEIVLAVIYTESRFNPNAVNAAETCFGWMQINEHCHTDRMERVNTTDLFDPIQNVRVGVDYLTELQSSGRTLKYSLMIYNMGFANAKKCLNKYGYSSYANKVVEYAENIQASL